MPFSGIIVFNLGGIYWNIVVFMKVSLRLSLFLGYHAVFHLNVLSLDILVFVNVSATANSLLGSYGDI